MLQEIGVDDLKVFQGLTVFFEIFYFMSFFETSCGFYEELFRRINHEFYDDIFSKTKHGFHQFS